MGVINQLITGGAPPCMGEVTIKFGFMTWGSKMMLEFWNIYIDGSETKNTRGINEHR
jgi:hypothetical protein